VNSPAIFPHGGSTITQQLVRCHFLKDMTVFQNMTGEENSNQLRHGVLLPRVLSYMIGSRSVNMLVRKLEEIRLSFVGRKQDAGAFRFENAALRKKFWPDTPV